MRGHASGQVFRHYDAVVLGSPQAFYIFRKFARRYKITVSNFVFKQETCVAELVRNCEKSVWMNLQRIYADLSTIADADTLAACACREFPKTITDYAANLDLFVNSSEAAKQYIYGAIFNLI